MRDFRAGNRRGAGYTRKIWENEEWNPYAGEEEPIGKCCGEKRSGIIRGRDVASGEMPKLNEKELNDIRRWSGQRPVPPIPVPERGNRPSARSKPVPNPDPFSPIPKPVPKPTPKPNPFGPVPKPVPKPDPFGPMPRPMPKPNPDPFGPVPKPNPNPDPFGPVPKPSSKPAPGWGSQAPVRPDPVRPKREQSVLKTEWRIQEQCDQTVESQKEIPYTGYGYEDIIEEERQLEKDLRMLQSMYPEAVKEILPCVGEICDRMEYEGSMMFDERPDKTTVRRLSDEIYEKLGDVWPREPVQEPDGVMSMQYQGDGRGPLGELIQVLLLQEMHHRRCRHRRCRPHMF